MEEIGIYGGTFNPIHLGHLHLAEEMQQALHFDRLLLIPANTPPHKRPVDLASGRHRLEMVRLAAEGLENAFVSDIELQAEGKSYTWDTVQKLRYLMPDSRFTLIMGADMLLSFDQWHKWRELLGQVKIAAAARDDGEEQAMQQKAAALSPDGRITVLKTTPLPMSSTQIREMIRRGEDPSAFLPPAVWRYIQRYKLYSLNFE